MKMKTLLTALLVVAIIVFGLIGINFLFEATGRFGMDTARRISNLVAGIVCLGTSTGLLVWQLSKLQR